MRRAFQTAYMQDFDGKRHSESGKVMCKERLSAAHCGGAHYGCAHLQCNLPVRFGTTSHQARAYRYSAPRNGYNRCV